MASSGPLALTADYRVNALLRHQPERCATLAEYAAAAGEPVEQVLGLLDPLVTAGLLALEIVADEVFIHTAPHGRSTAPPALPANLWETLREGRAAERAYRDWVRVRTLERAGWRVECRPARLSAALGDVRPRPRIAVLVGATAVPLVEYARLADLEDPFGVLDPYERRQVLAVAVVCPPGELDPTLTAVRAHLLRRPRAGIDSVLVLEEPGYHPTLINTLDGSLEARSVSRTSLDAEGLSTNP